MEVTDAQADHIKLENKDNSITLDLDSTAAIMGELKFKVADNNPLRFYPMVECVIGKGAAEEPPAEEETPTPSFEAHLYYKRSACRGILCASKKVK